MDNAINCKRKANIHHSSISVEPSSESVVLEDALIE
jgi:hypothetical protein